jgi:hypothetical protein
MILRSDNGWTSLHFSSNYVFVIRQLLYKYVHHFQYYVTVPTYAQQIWNTKLAGTYGCSVYSISFFQFPTPCRLMEELKEALAKLNASRDRVESVTVLMISLYDEADSCVRVSLPSLPFPTFPTVTTNECNYFVLLFLAVARCDE